MTRQSLGDLRDCKWVFASCKVSFGVAVRTVVKKIVKRVVESIKKIGNKTLSHLFP
jgi:hypothetical protein